MDAATLKQAKNYADKLVQGLGSIKGANCTIKSTTVKDNGTEITFEWIGNGNGGLKETETIFVKNGEQGNGISKVEKIKTVGLIDTYRITFDDGSTFDYDINNGGGSTDEKVKLSSAAKDAKYLNELIDNSTIKVDTDNNYLVVKKIDGQTVTVTEINFLTGVKSNIQEQINNLGKSMTMYGVFGTKADLLASVDPVPVDGNTAIVIADEDNNNKQMTYIYIASTSKWTQVAESSIKVRDFTTNPINLSTEVTGTLAESKIDNAIARLADVLDKATYKGSADGIVKQADTLTGLTVTIAALNQAITDSHKHNNKTLLDKIVSDGLGSSFLADNGEYISILSIGTSAPSYTSQIWIDNTDTSKLILKIYDGTDWIAVSGGSNSGCKVYIGNTEPTDKDIELWINPDEIGSGGTGGGSEVFDRDDLTAVTVGGLSAGSSVKGKSTKDVLEEILFPYQKPTVSFSITPSTTTYAVGDTISSIKFTINAGKKSKDIQSIKVYNGSTLLTTITDSVANGGTFTYNYACNITASTTLKVEVADDTSTVYATKSITFAYRSYYGFVADGTTVDETAVKGLQKNVLKTSKALTYSGITCTNSKIVYAYPQSQGLLGSILDGNGFDYLGSYNYSVISVDGVNYYVYVLIDPATLEDFMQKFA